MFIEEWMNASLPEGNFTMSQISPQGFMHYTVARGEGKGLEFRMQGENMTPPRLRQTEGGKWGRERLFRNLGGNQKSGKRGGVEGGGGEGDCK